MMVEKRHGFGGTWTEDKLARVEKYLRAFTTALKRQPFRLMYVDAFAGTGYRATKQAGEKVRGTLLFPEMREFVKGSARRALEIEPPFDHYVFIEADKTDFKS